MFIVVFYSKIEPKIANMTQKYSVRKAVLHDCERLLELIKELALFEKAPEEVTVTLEHMIESGFGNDKIWEAFVLEVEDEIIGMSLFYKRYSTWKGVRLYLEDLIVTEKHRGKGYGQILLERTLLYAKEKQYQGVVWQVLDWNTPAIEFYKKYNAKFDASWINVSVD